MRYLLGLLAGLLSVLPAAAAAADTQAPTAPPALTATPGVGRVDLAWAASTDDTGVTGYYVWRKVTGGMAWANLALTAARAYSDAAVADGTTYTYSVRARDAAGNISASSPFAVGTPVPAGTPAPAGAVLWKSDAESSMAAEWASSSSIPVAVSPPAPDPTRINQSAFHAQGARSYYFGVRYGDDSFGARAELGDALPALSSYQWKWFREGDDRWISLQYYVPPTWPADGTWMTALQLKPTTAGGGGPSVGLDLGGNKIMFYGNSNAWGSTAGGFFDGAGPLPGGSWPLTKAQWLKLTWHVVFSADPAAGRVEVFGDLADGQGMRTLAPLRTRATMKYNRGVMDPAHLRVGVYRDPSILTAGSLYVDGVTVATTRAAAEANAFGP